MVANSKIFTKHLKLRGFCSLRYETENTFEKNPRVEIIIMNKQ